MKEPKDGDPPREADASWADREHDRALDKIGGIVGMFKR